MTDLIERLRKYAENPYFGSSAFLFHEAATALATERERAEKAEKERDERLEELGRIIMACPPGMRTSPASDGVKQLRTSLAEARRLLKAMLSNPDKISKDDARRFLAQESNHGR
jgi:hypothetical protein